MLKTLHMPDRNPPFAPLARLRHAALWITAVVATSVAFIFAEPGGAESAHGSSVITFADSTILSDAITQVSALASARRLNDQSVVADIAAPIQEHLRSLPGVLGVESDSTYHAADLPNDPCISSPSSCNGLSSSYVNQIGLDGAWSNSHGAGVTIAVLDGGIDPTNAEVTSKLVAPEVDYVGDGASTHGTSVAALAAGATNNGVGTAGTGWDATLLSYKVLDKNGSGLLSNVLTAMDAASSSGAKVIVMSFAGAASVALDNAVANARAKGSVIVAAAGNESSTQPVYPAASPGAIAVGTVTSSNTIADFSNSGPWVDLYAPGVALPAPNNNGVIKPFTGTSASAPLVAGVAALLISRQPNLTPDGVTYVLALTAANKDNGFSVIDANKAVSTWSPYQGNANGVKIAGGNFDHDPAQEIVTGAGQGGGPHVIVADRTGQVLSSFFAYDPAFTGGVDVASGDCDGDGVDEIITGAGPGGGPHVRVFRTDGSEVTSFFPYGLGFRGGVNVASGDFDGDGVDEIITGAGPGGGPHVTVRRCSGELLASFFAYDPAFPGGVDVASRAASGAIDELITGAGPGGGPHVKIFSLGNTAMTEPTLRSGFFAYDPSFQGGVRVSSVDIEGDGLGEILTGAGAGGGPHVTIRTSDGTMVRSLFSFDPSFSGGVDVGNLGGSYLTSALTTSDSARIFFVRQ